MAVRIRLKRIGKIHRPIYRVVVVDQRKKRDGRVIEEVGQYDPNQEPSLINISSDRAQYWLGVGAQPSDAVRKLLVLTGDISKFKGNADASSRVKYRDADAEATAKAQAVAAASDEAEKRKAEVAAEKEAQQKAAEEAAAKEAQENAAGDGEAEKAEAEES